MAADFENRVPYACLGCVKPQAPILDQGGIPKSTTVGGKLDTGAPRLSAGGVENLIAVASQWPGTTLRLTDEPQPHARFCLDIAGRAVASSSKVVRSLATKQAR